MDPVAEVLIKPLFKRVSPLKVKNNYTDPMQDRMTLTLTLCRFLPRVRPSFIKGVQGHGKSYTARGAGQENICARAEKSVFYVFYNRFYSGF